MAVKNYRQAILVGGGRVGHRTATHLTENGYTVTIIERDADNADELTEYPGSRIIVGDGTDVDVFQEANPTMADVVAGLTDDTETNLAVCELAREIVPGVRTLVRVNDDGEQDYAYLQYVDNIVYPAAAGASVAATKMTGDNTHRIPASRIR